MLHIHVLVQWHDEIDDAHVYKMKCNFVGAKHLGCYKGQATGLGHATSAHKMSRSEHLYHPYPPFNYKRE